MGNFALAILSLFSALAIASPTHYQIQAKIFLDGKLIAAPRITTNGTEAAEISQVSSKSGAAMTLKVAASDVSNAQMENGIGLKLNFQYNSSTRAINSAPEVVVQPGHETTITPPTNSNVPNTNLKIKLVATRE